MKLPLIVLAVALESAAFPLFNLATPTSLIASLFSSQDSSPKDRLIVTAPDSPPLKVSEREKFHLKQFGVNFFDITEHTNWFFKASDDTVVVPTYNYPTNVSYSDEVLSLITQIDKDNLHDNLATFSSFFTRYYKSDTGRQSAQWLFTQLKSLVANATDTDVHISLKPFAHNWAQFSIILSIRGSKTPEDVVVVGCHQDSTNLLFPSLLGAPGADDDGSGVTTNLEALRILLESGFKPANTVEFHFYSAEEGGLLGSLDVFNSYKEDGKKVVAMLQQDMTGYVQKTLDNGIEEHVGVIGDNVNPELTDFVKLVIDSYLSIPWRETSCGYACSDHASALKNGYPSSFIIESEFKYTSPYIHSTKDTLDKLSFDHIAEFTKLVLGYAVELGFHEFERLDN